MVAKKNAKKNAKKARAGNPRNPTSRANPLAAIIAAVLIPVLLIGLSLYAKNLTTAAWDAVVKYQSPYLFKLEPQPPTGRPATGGVLLIIVDGLRLDNSRKLDNFNRAREAGADLSDVVGQPSLSDPAAAVIPSGTSQEIHGVTTNWCEGLIQVDNLFQAAKRAGKMAAVVAGKGWVDLYGDSIGTIYKFDDSAGDYDEQVFNQAMAILRGAEGEGRAALPDLLVVHFGGVDNASHEHGGTSPEALTAAQKIDGYIGQLLGAYDLASRTAILTADHGHIATGGHGGWEPEVLNVPLVFVGKAVKPGPQPPANQVDIAPTVSALLGMGMPAHTVGTILENVVAIPQADLAQDFINLGRTRYNFSKAYVEVVAAKLNTSDALSQAKSNLDDGNGLLDEAWVHAVAGDAKLATETAKGAIYLLDESRVKAKEARMGAERASRLPTAAVLALVPLVVFIYLGRNRFFSLALGGAVLYFALYNVLFFLVHRFKWSLSIFNEESMIKSFFNDRTLEAAIIVVVAGLVMGVAAGLRSKYSGPELAQGAATMSLLVAYGLGLQILLFYYLYGVSFGWFIPNLVWGFKFYVDLLQMVPTGFASVLVVPVVLLGAKLASLVARGRGATPPVGAK